MDLIPFVITIFVLGFFMSLGKAAVYKHIPVYYPGHIGSVGGLVGMIGGLGGFIMPIAFGVMADLTAVNRRLLEEVVEKQRERGLESQRRDAP